MKQTIVISLIGTLHLLIGSCSNAPHMTFTVEHRQILSGIPSASGIVKEKDALYVIGDNSAWLYQLNNNYEVTNQHLLLEGLTDSILPKTSKPDFEAMTAIQTDGKIELLIFGSGSKRPERDVIASVNLTDGIHTTLFHSTGLYDALRTSTYLNAQSINIEAAANVGDALYLFNREHNLLFEYPLKTFLGFLEGRNDLPTYQVYRINLPRLNGISAKFSGASAVPGTQQLVFTASVEDTPNTYDDGAVIGSYVGIIALKDLKDGYQPLCTLITDNLKPIAIKIESVEVVKVNKDTELNIVMVTDSDGGESELLLGKLNW